MVPSRGARRQIGFCFMFYLKIKLGPTGLDGEADLVPIFLYLAGLVLGSERLSRGRPMIVMTCAVAGAAATTCDGVLPRLAADLDLPQVLPQDQVPPGRARWRAHLPSWARPWNGDAGSKSSYDSRDLCCRGGDGGVPPRPAADLVLSQSLPQGRRAQ